MVPSSLFDENMFQDVENIYDNDGKLVGQKKATLWAFLYKNISVAPKFERMKQTI